MSEEIQKSANPAALGLGGFALSTFFLNLANAGIIGSGSMGIVMPFALFYGGLAQFAAGMWDLYRGGIFGGTCFSSFGAFWIGLASFELLSWSGVVPADPAVPTAALTAMLICWGIFTFYATIASLKEPTSITWVFITLTILFFLLAWGEYNPTVRKIAGYEGLLCAAIAWYSSAAILINTMHEKTILPMGE